MSLRPIFSSIARKYIWINTIITGGLDRVWRQKCAMECAKGHVIIDLCCGTGDLSRAISEYSSGDVFLVGVDFNKEMLAEAASKKRQDRQNQNGAKKAEVPSLSFVVADAGIFRSEKTALTRLGTHLVFEICSIKIPEQQSTFPKLLGPFRKAAGSFVLKQVNLAISLSESYCIFIFCV